MTAVAVLAGVAVGYLVAVRRRRRLQRELIELQRESLDLSLSLAYLDGYRDALEGRDPEPIVLVAQFRTRWPESREVNSPRSAR